MSRVRSQLIAKMVTVALLAALGTILMLYVKLPYPPAPWCEIEFSDTTILVAYVLTGYMGAIGVAVIKTVINMLILPVSQGTALFVGQVAAIICSLTYLLGIYLCAHVFKLFKKGIWFRLIGYFIIALLVSVVMTILNIIFVTPSFLCGYWTTCFDAEAVKQVQQALSSQFGTDVYTLLIMIIYIPFNFVKAICVLAVYELLFNTLIFIVLRNNPTFKKYFSKGEDSKKTALENNPIDEQIKKDQE